MTKLNYAKKRLAPVITKYGIDVESDSIFQTIIPMFDNQTDYQIWALKLIKEGITDLSHLTSIKNWADVNSTEIKNLIKKNIISYKTKEDIDVLFKEMRGLDLLKEIKKVVNKFNTNQRNMLSENLMLDDEKMNGLYAYNSPIIQEWYVIMKAFNKMPSHRQQKLIVTSSAINDDFNFLKKHIFDAFSGGYVWDREDLLRYMQVNAKDCAVVFDEGNVIMLQVPTFDSSKALCGNGRTSWCLTRQSSYFSDYVTNKKAKQFFVFDFNKQESDELSHIGFTVQKGGGISNAHSTTNQSLMSPITYNGKRVDIHQALSDLHIGYRMYLNLDRLTRFNWTIKSITEYVNNRADTQIVYSSNDVIVVRIDHHDALSALLGHTRINLSNCRIGENTKAYVVMNLNVPYNDDYALALCMYKMDPYGVETFNKCFDAYGADKDINILGKFGLTSKNFLNAMNIKPELLLHKYIDQGLENEAIELLKNTEIDVNVKHQFSQPIFKTIENAMVKLFKVLVQNKNLDWADKDGVGDTILSHLIYAYLYETSRDKQLAYTRMIDFVLSLNIDFNIQDTIGETMLMIASESKNGTWIVERLLKNPSVEVNIVTEDNCTALTKAIQEGLMDTVKLLLKRTDTVIRQEDIDEARQRNIDLTSMAKSVRQDLSSKTMSQLFENAFAK